MRKKLIYPAIILISVLLIILSLTVLDDTQIAAPIVIALSVYMLIGSTIKLCKSNKKLKSVFSNVFDLLFWLP